MDQVCRLPGYVPDAHRDLTSISKILAEIPYLGEDWGHLNFSMSSSMVSRDSNLTKMSVRDEMTAGCSARAANASASRREVAALLTDSLT